MNKDTKVKGYRKLGEFSDDTKRKRKLREGEYIIKEVKPITPLSALTNVAEKVRKATKKKSSEA